MIGEYREWARQVTHSLSELELRVERLERRVGGLPGAGQSPRPGSTEAVLGALACVGLAAFRTLAWRRCRRADRR